MEASEYLNEYLIPIRNFLTIGIGKATFPTSITMHTARYGNPDSAVDVYYHDRYFREQDEISPMEMNFTLDEINISDSIQYWFGSFRECPRLHYMYFGTEINDRLYQDIQFMYYVFGLEAYHRQNFSPKLMDSSDYKDIRDEIVEKIPDIPAKSRMKDILESLGNEPSVKNRFMDIFKSQNTVLSPLFDLEETARNARDLRHNIAHTVGDDYDPSELGETSENLRAAAGACLMDGLPMDDSTIRGILKNNYRDVFPIK